MSKLPKRYRQLDDELIELCRKNYGLKQRGRSYCITGKR